jgi:hypothetical protein
MKRWLFVAAPMALLIGVLLLGASRGQAPTVQRQYGIPVEINFQFSGSGASSKTRSEIKRIVAELRDATEEAKKADITKKLEAAVTKFFDEDQKARETDLTKLEERLKKLRAQLDRRSKAKADIIQLQIKVLVNEAEGLGFSGTSLLDPIPGVNGLPALGVPGVQPAAIPAPPVAP